MCASCELSRVNDMNGRLCSELARHAGVKLETSQVREGRGALAVRYRIAGRDSWERAELLMYEHDAIVLGTTKPVALSKRVDVWISHAGGMFAVRRARISGMERGHSPGGGETWALRCEIVGPG